MEFLGADECSHRPPPFCAVRLSCFRALKGNTKIANLYANQPAERHDIDNRYIRVTRSSLDGLKSRSNDDSQRRDSQRLRSARLGHVISPFFIDRIPPLRWRRGWNAVAFEFPIRSNKIPVRRKQFRVKAKKFPISYAMGMYRQPLIKKRFLMISRLTTSEIANIFRRTGNCPFRSQTRICDGRESIVSEGIGSSRMTKYAVHLIFSR